MNTARVLIYENSQAVILPEDCQVTGEEVYIKKVGGALVLIPKDSPWQSLFDSLSLFSEDFMDTREQPPIQTREELFE